MRGCLEFLDRPTRRSPDLEVAVSKVHTTYRWAVGVLAVALAGEASAGAKVKADPSEDEKQVAAGNHEFLGVKFAAAFGALIIPDRVDEAHIARSTDSNGNETATVVVTKASGSRPALLLENHLLMPIPNCKNCEVVALDGGGTAPLRPVSVGWGPFLSLQSSQEDIVDSIGFGLMVGLRQGTDNAFNIGLGRVLDPNAKSLAEGFVDGQPAPPGATEVQFLQESKWGWVVLVSFSF